MNLYKHTFEHWSQKDSEKGISNYFLAENNLECYDKVYGKWGCMTADRISSEEPDEHWETGKEIYYIDGEEYPGDITDEEVKKIVAEKGGELNFDDLESLNCWSDLYYGLRLDGWVLVQEDIKTSEIFVLKELSII